MILKCRRCGHPCEGTMMKTNPGFTRIRSMMEREDVPRDKQGRFLICHFCQRTASFVGGFTELLVRDLASAAHSKKIEKPPPRREPYRRKPNSWYRRERMLKRLEQMEKLT